MSSIILNIRTHWRALALWLLAAVILAFVIGASDPVKACLGEQPQSHATKTPPKGLGIGGIRIISPHCIWAFAEHSSEPVIALATIALFIATYRLWKATHEMVVRADVNTKSQLEVMNGQLVAMQQQGKAASDTLDQIRREFAVANRPKLRLRRIYFTKGLEQRRWTSDNMGGVTELPFDDSTPPNVIIEMANIGGVGVAKASMRVTFIIFNKDQPLPWKIQEELAKAVPQEMDISHGGSGVLDVRVPAVGALFYDRGVQLGSQTVYCIGYVEYTDETATLMGRTGFIRQCDARNGWFLSDHSPGGADFEYAD